MELPQPRPLRTEAKTPTHDFLSLYSHSSFSHQDPRPSSQGNYLRTHDFLQPLERVGKDSSKGENTAAAEKPPPSSSSSSAEHVLPGGIGTYSISHISNINQKVPKPERMVCAVSRASSAERNGEASKTNSNCSSYSRGGFALWEESALKDKGTTTTTGGKDNTRERQVIREPAKLGPWSSERPLHAFVNHSNSFSPLTSSNISAQKKQNFLEMMKSAKGHQEEEVDDEEEFCMEKEGTSHRGGLTVKLDGKSTDQKNVTPRSKHSATEQRRRSKINDRFQILRDLIPHSDQRRDKASFLLEVIEYVQFLQEKVQKYEGSYQGWSHQPTKLMPWRNSHGPMDSFVDHSEGVKNDSAPGLMLGGKFDENNITVTPTVLSNAQNPLESVTSTVAAYKEMDHHPVLLNKAIPVPMPLQPNIFSPILRGGVIAQPPEKPGYDVDNMGSQPQSQLWQNRPYTTECPATSDPLTENEDLSIGGTISISTVYSQGLLNTLTQALQTSGVNLSQASISVQIDIGKRANSSLTAMTSSAKDQLDPSSSNRAMAHSLVASSGEDSDQAPKRLKSEKS